MKTFEVNQVAMYMYELMIYHKWLKLISANKQDFMGLIISATGPRATSQKKPVHTDLSFYIHSIKEERA